MYQYPLHCDVRRTESTTDLLRELLSSTDAGFQPAVLGSWAPEPTYSKRYSAAGLALLLDEPLALRKSRTGHTPAQRLTWYCSIRNTTRVALREGHWLGLAQVVVRETGIAPHGDPDGCRWAALSVTPSGLDIVATVIRQDGRWARLHNDSYLARDACANVTAAYLR